MKNEKTGKRLIRIKIDKMEITNILQKEMLGNLGSDYLRALGIFLLIGIIFYFFQKVVIFKLKKEAKKTKTSADDFVLETIKNIKPPIYFFIAFYIGFQTLSFHPIFQKVIFGAFLIVIVIQGVLVVQKAVDYILKKKIRAISGDDGKSAMLGTIGQIIKWALWVLGALLVLSNLGVNVTSLIAGLGIGGIAIALAAQNILEDVFASFSIFIDRPFDVGDFIKIGQDSGTVKKIGIKTTRIMTLNGNEMSIPNKKLTDVELQNFTRREMRRKIFSIGVAYETSSEKLRKIKTILGEIISQMDGDVELERVNLDSFGDFSLNFEISIVSENLTLEEFRQAKEDVYLAIFEKFRQEGIEFAYPTQTIYAKN